MPATEPRCERRAAASPTGGPSTASPALPSPFARPQQPAEASFNPGEALSLLPPGEPSLEVKPKSVPPASPPWTPRFPGALLPRAECPHPGAPHLAHPSPPGQTLHLPPHHAVGWFALSPPSGLSAAWHQGPSLSCPWANWAGTVVGQKSAVE